MAKAKDDIERRRIITQQKQLAQGALFIIDNSQPVPPNVDLRAFTNAAIEQHLAQHTYYQQEKGMPGLGNRIRVDAIRMRKYITDLSKKSNKVEKTLDALFRGTSDIIKAEAKKSYEYDKDTFSEGDLPGHEEEAKATTSSASKSPSQAMAVSSSPHSPQVMLPGPSKRALEVLDDSQHRSSKRLRTNTSAADESHQASSFTLSHSCENCYNSRRSCDRQWPCTRCADKEIGVEGCIGRHEDRERTMGTTASETTRPGGVEAEQTMRSGLDASMSVDGERSDTTDGQKGQDGTAVVLEKEQHAQTDSSKGHEVLASHSSPLGPLEHQAQGVSSKTRPGEEQSGGSAPAFGASTLDLSGTMSAPAQADEVASIGQPVVCKSTKSAKPRNPHRQEDAQPLHHVDTRVLAKQLESIRRDVEWAVRNLLECIGDLKNQTCPLELKPSDQLSALYARCLGPDWAKAVREYNRFNSFTAVQATMSLVSAFLYDNILAQQAYDPDVIQDVVQLLQTRGITGRAAEAVFDFANREKNVFESACNIATEEARAALAQDTDTFQRQLQAEAEGHMKTLRHILAPHFRNHLQLARSLHLSSGKTDDEVEEELLKIFEQEITALIHKLLDHKIKVVAAGYEYSYFWPNNGDEIDGNEMVELGAHLYEPLVRYTVFPGLKVDVPSSTIDPGDPVRAFIMTKRAPYVRGNV